MSASKLSRASPGYEHDPVAAYNRLAPHYSQLSSHRAAYLRGVEDCVTARLPRGAASLLDIGAGDGSRAVRVASASGIKRIVLIEPSAAMSRLSPDFPTRAKSGLESATLCQHWHLRAEELDAGSISERFDAITCLWNVLGHVPDARKRVGVLNAAAQLLSRKGSLFLDVIHRYNLLSYGALMTSARWLKDQFIPSELNGDVVATWSVGGAKVSTYGHVFTDSEIMVLAKPAGLQLEERLVIDYETGESRPFSCLGNLLYIFRRSSLMDSPSATQTS